LGDGDLMEIAWVSAREFLELAKKVAVVIDRLGKLPWVSRSCHSLGNRQTGMKAWLWHRISPD
jgi:hypothetical protein